ncbi:hypothetical protein HH212_22815 [Massilia forsythiae]|uniref:DUF3037 domain-containing protein n=1 Tax=Massilia forsythiae TaxID=2728020 RepID=A0A7Z2ZUN8_9BURK|nr:hypothetical protein [Massilia forsythiae]QJE02500.1 hypothetical protein HH212_22815 [Massilia forsythiae]
MSQNNVFSGLGGFDHLSDLAVEPPKPSFTGAWATVELQPDVFVPQRFTVGVAVQSPGGRLHFKLLDDFRKFDCVYQGRFSQRSAREILAHAEQNLRVAAQSKTQLAEMRFETSALSLSTPSFTSGDDHEATVERLFDEVVVMGQADAKKIKEFESIDTPRARQLVNAELKKIAQMDFEKIARSDNQGLLLDQGGVTHFLDLNLLTERACGSVASAVYKTAQSVELNLLKTSRDLTTYARVHDFHDIGLFLLLPEPETLPTKEYRRITEVIADHEWKLERDGFRVVSLPSPAGLASEIYDWALPTIRPQ